MKKIIAFMLAMVAVLSLSGCMSSAANQTKVQTVTDPESIEGISYEDYDDSLEGLCEYFAALGYAYEITATSDESSDPIVMTASMIGAERGYKFTYNYKGDTTVLELYYYTDLSSDYYKQAKSEGKVTVSSEIENGTVDVVLSDNGKYMMIYNDAAENETREAEILEAFKGFYA